MSQKSFGEMLPDVRTPIPGDASRAFARRLSDVESRDITFSDDGWPVFWEEAGGANVRDADGNVFLDLTAAFGVALLGHAHPAVVAAVERQAGRLLHGMGDVHPPTIKLELLERLCSLAPWDGAKGVLASSGSEAMEGALKTALIATGRPGLVAVEGGYHGLTLGSLAVTSRAHFRGPFERRIYDGVGFIPFPDGVGATAESALDALRNALRDGVGPAGDPVGAVVVEPVQGRAGVRLFPEGFLGELSTLAHEAGALVIADEIFTGMGRCGAYYASAGVGLDPDVVCVGKALGGGMPISACLGLPEVMDAWPESGGEAIHTSTFLGHPLGCAAALAVLETMESEAVPVAVARVGSELREALSRRLDRCASVREVRGMGLMIGIELDSGETAMRVVRGALAVGVVLLPAGAGGEVIELVPPVSLTAEQAAFAVETLGSLVEAQS